MTIEYISGFFDADGSISLMANGRGKNKTIQISFHNNELDILKDIQLYFDKLDLKGFISIKPAKKETHSDSYELKYVYNKALEVAKLLKSSHPKKLHRINTCLKYYKKVTPRNGKYSNELLRKKQAFDRLFFMYH